jgi:hypothetical protein
MKESLLGENGCFAGCLEDEVEWELQRIIDTRNVRQSHATQSGKHHVIQELQTHGIFSFNYPFLVSDFVILLFFQHPHRVTSNIHR